MTLPSHYLPQVSVTLPHIHIAPAPAALCREHEEVVFLNLTMSVCQCLSACEVSICAKLIGVGYQSVKGTIIVRAASVYM